MDPETTAPPIVAVVVSYDPGPWFDEALASLAAQDYPNLSVLVIDAASLVDLTGRVAAVVPGAFVRRLTARVPYGRAANDVLGVVDGASHYLFCHDDVVLAPDAVRLMVEEAFRSNAGIVSPKIVEWDRPDRLLAVGSGADRVGVEHPLVEAGELDQAQHDGVRDVFVAPGAAMLVRADLFAALGGFDPDIADNGEDLNFSWRVQIAGARVVVAPAAVVRHLEATTRGVRPGSTSANARRRARDLSEAHRVRTVLVCYGLVHLLWALPLMLVSTIGEAIWQLGSGRPGRAWATLRSVGRGMSRPRRLLRSRRNAQRHRRVPDRQVARLQAPGNTRLRTYIRSRVEDGPAAAIPVADPGERPPVPPLDEARVDDARDPGEPAPAVGGGSWQLPLTGALVVAALLVVGSRSLFAGVVPAVGSLPSGSGTLGGWWHSWWSTWRSAGMGHTGPGAPGLGLLALLGAVFFGAVGTLQHVLVLAPLVLGPFGAYRAARWWGSQRGRLAALIVYATVPVPYDALARGRWSGLVIYAGAPWVLAAIGRLSGGVPFPATTARAVLGRVVGLGVLVAVLASVAPAYIFVVVAIGVGLAAGSILTGTLRVGLRALSVAVAGAVVAAVLLLPWSASVLTSRAATFGVKPTGAARLGLGQLLLFHTGPVGNGVLGWGLLAAAALPLLIGSSWRLAWAARMWLVALTCIGLTWAGLRGWVPVPDPEVLLAPAAAALAGAVALGAVAFELDLPGYRFGWRQLASGVAAAAVVIAAVPAVQAAGSGRWNLPDADASSVLGFLPSAAHGDYRVLWVGAPGALPLPSSYLEDGFGYATSYDGLPDATDIWAGRPGGTTPVLASDLRLVTGRLTTKLGHLLAPLAVRYIVVPNHLGPSGSGAPAVPAPGRLLQGLGQQTDLQALGVDADYSVYVNAAWAPAHSVLTPAVAASLPAATAGAAATARAVEALRLAGSAPVLTGSADGGRGRVPAPSTLYVASSPGGGWTLRAGGAKVTGSPALGVGERFDVPAAASGRSVAATLQAPSSTGARAGQLAEVVLWLLVVAGLVLDQRRRRSGTPETVRPEWFTPLAPQRSGRRRRGGSNSGLSAGDADLGNEEVWIDV
ncbi:glycosyltransferase [Acidiferrimicrobium sp. IK]|uniref:glycosyltransferase n=1 Tax=Acidiferrimicrobium sp. IK TaxID=2871700 RepID=UPI0021CB0190|nr:glycosyltransferase [Acidiferrimicrobium sp. IK]MCU4185692.1 glycosyltransferase [Acidiferrimicrobium sp. IK]